MSDGTVGIRQNTSPDRPIDCETVVIGGDTVYRQRVQAPAVETKLDTLNAKDFATQTTLASLNSKDFSTQATSQAISDRIGALSSPASGSVNAQLATLQRSTDGDNEVRLDYDVRTDSNPVYIGRALPGTGTSSATWTIKRFTYDASARATRIQVLVGAWDSRAGLGW